MSEQKKSFLAPLRSLYEKQYKKLLILPIILIIASFAILAVEYQQTGDFFKRDVSLKGGVTISVTQDADPLALEDVLRTAQIAPDISVSSLTTAAGSGVVVEAGVTQPEQIDALISAIEQHTGELSEEDYSVQVIGASLSESFLAESFRAILIAFLFMGLVVFAYFRVLVPSAFIIWTVFVDMIGTFAVLNILNVHLSTAGLASMLMLIGYSIDTDILLTSRVLKGKRGTVFERTLGAMRTGMLMTLTALTAMILGLFLADSDTIRQIMLVLVIGLFIDVIHTWLTNASVLRWYVERREK